jgi:hypothetical protein
MALMLHSYRSLCCIVATGLWSQAAIAQLSAPPIPTALPGVSKISVANAAGVLKYCEQKDLVSGAATDAVLDTFANKPDVKSSDYLAGIGGEILGDEGKNYSIGQAPGYLQSEACNRVLQQAKTFRTTP